MKNPMAKRRSTDQRRRIDLLTPVQLLQDRITRVLCDEVFWATRRTERQRDWSLHALVEFWNMVVIQAPESLRRVMEEVREAGEPSPWPRVETTAEALYKRCRNLRPVFFERVFDRFVASLLPDAPVAFCPEFHFLRKDFPDVWALDGSRLDAVAHRLKRLWSETASVLPGCLLSAYDIFRGIPRLMKFNPDAAKSEFLRVEGVLPEVPKGTLLLGDRLYASVALFQGLAERGIFGLFRYNKSVSLAFGTRLSKRAWNGGTLEDWDVEAGAESNPAPQHLRLIRFRCKGRVWEVLTNVLDPERLPPEVAIELYRRRWKIERMFFHLKEVLDLKSFHGSSPNAVGLQVYATTLVYTAVRVAQAMAAKQVQVDPDEISTHKFFARVVAASIYRAGGEWGVRLMHHANPGLTLRDPTTRHWKKSKFASVPLDQVLVEKRNDHRRRRRFCKGRSRWKSFAV
jgi:hypothetical protein